MTIQRAPAAALLARADDWLEQTRADGELRAGWSRPTDAVLVLGSAQRVSAPGPWLRRSTGGGAVSCDDRYLMLDVVLPRGHPLVIDDVGQSYRWLARALQAALEQHGAKLRAVTPREAAALPVAAAGRQAALLARLAGGRGDQDGTQVRKLRPRPAPPWRGRAAAGGCVHRSAEDRRQPAWGCCGTRRSGASA